MASRARKRRSRSRALVRGGLAAGLVVTSACDSTASRQDAGAPSRIAAGSGGSATGGAGSAAVAIGGAGGSLLPPPPPIVITPEPVVSAFPTDQAVSRARPPRRVLYSWTTDEQYAELRDSPVLLTRSERPGQGGGVLRQVLADLAAAGDPLSMALAAPEFEKTRYAWPNPWATLLGWPGESYGDELIRIELRDDAWVMILDGTEWQVVDLEGAPVSRADAIDAPERIGALFHVHETDGLECGGSFLFGEAGSFREYALLNEAMIAGWSLATEEMRDRLEQDLELIEAFREHVLAGGYRAFGPFEADVACAWRRDAEAAELGIGAERFDAIGTADAYQLSLALASPSYAPTVENLDAIAAALEAALFEPDPIVRTNP